MSNEMQLEKTIQQKQANKNHHIILQKTFCSRNGSISRPIPGIKVNINSGLGSVATSQVGTPAHRDLITSLAGNQQNSGSNLIPRTGSASVFNFSYGQNKRDSINSSGSNLQNIRGQSSDKQNLQQKPLSQKLQERIQMLQNHLDNIQVNTDQTYPHFLEFQDKFQNQVQNGMTSHLNNDFENLNQNPFRKMGKTHALQQNHLVPFKSEDFRSISSSYDSLQKQLSQKDQELQKYMTSLQNSLQDIQSNIIYEQDQQQIMINDLELKLNGYFLNQAQDIDSKIEKDENEFIQLIEQELVQSKAQKQQDFNSQIEVIVNCLDQIEEEYGTRLEDIEYQINEVEQQLSQDQSNYGGNDQSLQYMDSLQEDTGMQQQQQAIQQIVDQQLSQMTDNIRQALESQFDKKISSYLNDKQLENDKLMHEINKANFHLNNRLSLTSTANQCQTERHTSNPQLTQNITNENENSANIQHQTPVIVELQQQMPTKSLKTKRAHNQNETQSQITQQDQKSLQLTQRMINKIEIIRTYMSELEQFTQSTLSQIQQNQESIIVNQSSEADVYNLHKELIVNVEQRKKNCDKQSQMIHQEYYELLKIKKQQLDYLQANSVDKSANSGEQEKINNEIGYLSQEIDSLQDYILNTHQQLLKQNNQISATIWTL
eukprot:403356111